TIRPQENTAETAGKKKGAPKGHQGYQRIVPSKANTVIKVVPKRTCPKLDFIHFDNGQAQ
ncbi:MAG: hypothetical protein ABIP14_16535, partial [Blastocatellia bacterium]